MNGYAGGSLDFETSNNFYHQITEHSKQKINERNGQPNDALEALSPETFEIPAKKNSAIWSTKQYRDDEHRQQLMTTTDRAVQSNLDPEISEKLRSTKHNIQRTIISEYSNAKNRGTVFTNPKFSSC